MDSFLSDEVVAGLTRARKLAERRSTRLKVRMGNQDFRILKLWDNGFSVDPDIVPNLRGLVDIVDGAKHLARCLIIRSEQQDGVMTYEFKRRTEVSRNAPLDYVADPDAPVALLR